VETTGDVLLNLRHPSVPLISIWSYRHPVSDSPFPSSLTVLSMKAVVSVSPALSSHEDIVLGLGEDHLVNSERASLYRCILLHGYLWTRRHQYTLWSVFAIFISVSIDSLSGRDNDHSSSRIASGDSDSLVRLSSVSGGVQTGPTDPALAAAALACMRPSFASLRVKCAISESHSFYSGIFRARSSFGSFREHWFCGL
jgi:hypothetical protein